MLSSVSILFAKFLHATTLPQDFILAAEEVVPLSVAFWAQFKGGILLRRPMVIQLHDNDAVFCIRIDHEKAEQRQVRQAPEFNIADKIRSASGHLDMQFCTFQALAPV